MVTVVFTGPAHNGMGKRIVRRDLEDAAVKSGYVIGKTVKPDTDLLVASRKDTRKAKDAVRHHVTILTYEQFISALVYPVVQTHAPNRWVDQVPMTRDELEAIDEL